MQRHAQLAERTAKSAMSGISHIAEETRCVQDIAEAAIAEAKFVHSEVDSRVAMLVAQAEATTANAVDAFSKRVSEVAVQSEVQALHIVGTVAQQLGKVLK